MGGIPFWACDISGYCGDITDHAAMGELYTRWMQFGVFNPLSRAHHEGNHAAEPWMFGEEAEKNSRAAIQLKYQLFPYIYSYAREAYDKGIPIMRALLLEYPNDPETFKTDGQFLFGKELLVAPVVKKQAVTKKLYLPEGEWIDFNNSKIVYDGEQWITYKAPLNTTPLFVKKGSIIPMMPLMNYIHEQENYSLSVHIYPANENQEASFELYEDDGESLGYQKNIYATTKFSCVTKSKNFELKVAARQDNGYTPAGKRNIIFKVHTDRKPVAVVNGKTKLSFSTTTEFLKNSEKDFTSLQWSWDEKAGICLVKVPDNGKETSLSLILPLK
jgi:alpha-glucosidase